jgi:hypothetical protein
MGAETEALEQTRLKISLQVYYDQLLFLVKRITKYRRVTLTICSIAFTILFLTECIDKNQGGEKENSRVENRAFEQYAGSSACVGCHKNIYDTHVQTAHFLTSQPASDSTIKGSLQPGKNTFAFNKSVVVAMEKREDGVYQVEYFREAEKKARRMDIVVGSGTMGQSFLNWRQDQLFQLPITYFTAAGQWSNSPGFPDKVVFNRVITSRCLECHSTLAAVTSPHGKDPESFDRQHLIYGVDCEKCHGPAAKHVQFQTQNPNYTSGRFIINPARFTRQQNLDMCALCHGGRLQKTKPSFSFTAGNSLADYFITDTSAPDPDKIDVHGNQYGLLRASKCFKASTTLTCNSCHDTHQNEKGKTALFSQRCATCHTAGHDKRCKLQKTVGAAITKNCIDCHMPLKPSRAIAVFLPGAATPTAALIRSHFISIYPEETKKILAELKKKQ